MNCDGAIDSFDVTPFILAMTSTPPNYPEYYAQYPNCNHLNGDLNGDGAVNSFDLDLFTALLLGSGGATGLRVEYTWNAENRLTAVTPVSPQAGDKKVEFAYDYMVRRIEKTVYDWDNRAGEWEATPSLHRKFVWGGTGGSSASGWLLLMELDGNDDMVRKYTWGLDLSQTLSGAGGIGGLLSVDQAAIDYPAPKPDIPAGQYVYLYDANGNVGQLIAWASGFGGASGDEWHADRLVTHYEYDPYGNVVNQTGAYAEENPFRFSTKYFDDETGLGYWGYRYYSPRTGRWLSRDPLGEVEGLNLYACAQNNPIGLVDRLGLDWVPINGKWDAWLTGNAVTRLLNSAVEENPVYWLLRFLARHGSQRVDSFEVSNDTAVDAFMHSMMFNNILIAVENDAHTKAGKLKCVPGMVITGRSSGSQNGSDTVEWHDLRLVSPLTYVIQQFRYEAKWDCYLEKRCWCCKNGKCGQQRRVQCLLNVKGWDKYDFHAPDESIPPFKWTADGLQWLGGSFFLDWHATFRLRRNVRTWDCGDGAPRPSQTW